MRSAGFAVCRGYGLNRAWRGDRDTLFRLILIVGIVGRLAKFMLMEYTELVDLRLQFHHLCGQAIDLRYKNRS